MDLLAWLVMSGKIVVIIGALFASVPIMTWVERRGAALMQNRLGPNRVGPLGLLQPIADGIKFFFKEDPIPSHVEKFYYVIAPGISMAVALMTFAVIPIAAPISIAGRVIDFQMANLNVGILYIFAISSLGIFGIIIAGWASNNKYSLLGGLRSSSQMISYELSLGLSVIGMLMTTSSLQIGDIVASQGQALTVIGSIAIPKWGIFIQPLGFLIFITAMYAETNRLPFDLPEGESEIIAGYHLEYGSMKFASFMVAEYLNMATASGLIASLYFGGWQMLPGMHWLLDYAGSSMSLTPLAADILRVLFQVVSFAIKVAFFLWLFVWVRWTLPRFRYDQLMNFGWKVMLPLSLVNIMFTGFLIYLKVL